MQASIIEGIKDVVLVLTGARLTYLVQKRLFNNQRLLDVEKKEEEIILEAVKFLNFISDEISKLEIEKDSKNFHETVDNDFFPRLKLTSFQIRRLEDTKIWHMYEKVLSVLAEFSKSLLSPVISSKPLDLSEKKKACLIAEKEFVNYSIEYLKLKKTKNLNVLQNILNALKNIRNKMISRYLAIKKE